MQMKLPLALHTSIATTMQMQKPVLGIRRRTQEATWTSLDRRAVNQFTAKINPSKGKLNKVRRTQRASRGISRVTKCSYTVQSWCIHVASHLGI
jgi:hypothetical protein